MKTNAVGRFSKPRSSVPNELSIFCLPTIMEKINGTHTSIYCKILHKMFITEIGYGVWNCFIESRGISFYDYSTPINLLWGSGKTSDNMTWINIVNCTNLFLHEFRSLYPINLFFSLEPTKGQCDC